jgi:hypothetical protein
MLGNLGYLPEAKWPIWKTNVDLLAQEAYIRLPNLSQVA